MKKYILYILLALFIATPICAQHKLVSYQQGYARDASISLRPNLWKELVGLWKPSLGITGITTLRDVSGFHKNGVLNGFVASDWVISGNPKLPGYALNFDGLETQYGTVGETSDYNFGTTGSFSVGCWVRLDGIQPDATTVTLGSIIGKGGLAGTNPGFIVFARDETSSVQIRDVSENVAQVADGTDINDGNYHLLIATINRRTEILTLYTDGLVDGTPASTSGVGSISQTAKVHLGTRRDSSDVRTFSLDGQADHFFIIERVLNPSEILDMYNFPNAMFQTRRVAIGRVPDAPTGIQIFRRRIEACLQRHSDTFLTVNKDVFCPEENRLEFAFND